MRVALLVPGTNLPRGQVIPGNLDRDLVTGLRLLFTDVVRLRLFRFTTILY